MQKCPVELRHCCPNTPIYAITIAKAKNWDLTTLDITGTMDFKIEARRQLNIELEKQLSNKNIDTDTSKEATENLREMIKSEAKQEKLDCK